MPVQTPSGPVIFRRLWQMLRPQWGWIAVALILLVASMPGELFPAFIWRYVVDDLIIRHTGGIDPLAVLMSLHGRITDLFQLLLSALVWLFAVYALSLIASTFSTVILQRA